MLREKAEEALRQKHEHQLATRNEAEARKMRTRQDRMERQEFKEKQYQEMCQQRAHDRMIKNELMMLAQQDREDYRERHDRISEMERQHRMDVIQQATDENNARKKDQQQLLQERAANRKQAFIDKVKWFDHFLETDTMVARLSSTGLDQDQANMTSNGLIYRVQR